MDKESLKNLYKEALNKGSLSEKGGAGLGLIEMARKSGNKLGFEFEEINDEYSYFYFQTKVGKENVLAQTDNVSANLLSAKNIHRNISEKKIKLIYSGDFSQENLKSILAITEEKFSGESNFILKKRMFNIIVELVQNIYKHGEPSEANQQKIPGILIIANADNEYQILSGNIITNAAMNELKSKLDLVNASSEEEIEKLFSQKISDRDSIDPKGAGLGLIDLRMKSGNTFAYEFEQINEHQSFFSILVHIPAMNN